MVFCLTPARVPHASHPSPSKNKRFVLVTTLSPPAVDQWLYQSQHRTLEARLGVPLNHPVKVN